MKCRKAPGEDGIETDLLKEAKEFYKGLAQLFTQCIQKRKLSENINLEIEILLLK